MKNNNIALTAINTKDGSPTIYRTEACTLIVTLINETSDVINLQPGQTSLFIEIPDITASELKSTIITADNWSIDIEDTIIELTYDGTIPVPWANNGKLIFTIAGLKTDAQPQTGNLQVNTMGFNPKIPSQLFTPITISNPPVHGNANLHDVLQIQADNGGTIFISPISEGNILEKLENELLINIKNISDAPLHTTKGESSKKNPRIEVTFVYGSTIGCLTPCNMEEGGTSAWDIHAAVSYKTPEYGWVAHQPQQSGDTPCPQWIFQPESTNTGLIGSGPNANITLSFSQIVAVTPPGHTQVLLHFIDFMKDDTTPYDDAVFVIDMVKKAPPTDSGGIYFYSMDNNIDVYDPNATKNIEFKWVTFNVAKIEINLDNTILPLYTKEYHTSSLLKQDQKLISLKVGTKDISIVTLTAYNTLGHILNKIQFILSIRKFFFTDPRDNNTYNGVRIGNRIWMTQNLACDKVLSKKCKEAENGRLYSWESAQPPTSSDGWKLPTPDDWEDLLKSCPASTTPYAWLIKDGKSGFNALLGGYTQPGFPGNRVEGIIGRYWLNKEDGLSHSYTVSFNSIYHSVLYDDDVKMSKNSFVAVRYVKIVKE